MTNPSPAAIEHHRLGQEVLDGRAEGTLDQAREDALLARLDALWEQLSEPEREIERQAAADALALGGLDTLPLVDVDVKEGTTSGPPRAGRTDVAA